MLDSRLYFRRRLRPAAVAALLCHAGIASALGFGAIQVHSALNQPLDATINLVSLTADEKAALDVSMASADMFQRFGIERTALADRIRIAASDGNEASQVRLRLTTDTPVREPFLRFLIEAGTGSGRALREYTVLLDPPGRAPAVPATTRTAAAPAASSPASPGPVAPQPDSSEPVSPQPALSEPASRQTVSSEPAASAPGAQRTTTPAPASRSAVADTDPASDRYGPVKQGETLSRIADTVRRSGATLDQMQVAIYRDNPQAFNDNMNILLRGAMLAIPPVERIRAIDDGAARSLVREQRRQVVSRLATSTESTSNNTQAQASAPPATTGARLRLEAPGSDGSGAGFGNSAVGRADFGRLMSPDFDASAQNVVAAGNVSTNDAEPDAPADESIVSGSQIEPVRVANNAGTNAAAVAAAPSEDATVAAGDSESVSDPQNETIADGQTVDAAVDNDEASADYQPLPSEDVDVVATGKESGLLRPRNLLLVAAGLFLVVLLIVRNRRRQYQPVPLNFNRDDDATPAADDFGPADETPAQATVYDKPGIDTGAHGDKLAPGLRVQEADRQIRLGLFEEARATLEKGLVLEPANTDLQDKRLELDYVSGDAEAFDANIARFDTQLADDGVRWAGITSMGRVLLPDDPRFNYPTTTQPQPEPEPDTPQSLFDSFASGHDEASEELVSNTKTLAADRYFSLDDKADSNAAESAQRPPASDASAAGAIPDTPDDLLGDKHSSESIDIDPATLDGNDNDFQWQDSGPQPAPDHGEDGISFDLDSDTSAEPKRPAAPVTPIDTTEFDLDDDAESGEPSDEGDSVEVRLDLARMYIDMEDSATARELLQEAAREGDEAQRATAKELLEKI